MTAPSRVRVLEAPRPDAVGSTPESFLAWLGEPALLRIPGRDRARTRAVATLLHGNEPSGLRALHAFVRGGGVPAVDLLCFVGAVDAARRAPGFAHRMLPGRADLNRCFWEPFVGEEGEVAAALLARLRLARCEALVDLHNNSGHNPPYAVASAADAASLNLTALFAERLIASDLRLGTLTEATAHDFPSVTIECGRSGDPRADLVALAGLERYAALERIETRRVLAPHTAIFTDPVRVRARAGLSLAFASGPVADADLTLADDIDRHNFELLPPGVPVGWVGRAGLWPLEAVGGGGVDVSREFFALRDGLLETRRSTVPVMMTTDVVAARSDCLFYLVRARDPDEGRATGGAGPARGTRRRR